MSLANRWQQILSDLQTQGRYRSLRLSSGHDFTSNDYLGYGYGRRPCVTDATENSTREFSGMASRLLRGHHYLWEVLENLLATWHGVEAVVMMNSGYVANEGLLSTVITPDDWVASDQLNHASIIDGIRLSRAEKFIFQHNDLNDLETGLAKAHRQRQPERQLFVVTESLFSMEGVRTQLPELVELATRFDAHVIVDEAHSTGCFGATGAGLVDAFGFQDKVLATVHTGGKALGLMGAYICGSQQLKDFLINRCRHLIFTTAMAPAVARWWLHRIPQVQHDTEGRQRLHDNAIWLRQELTGLGFALPGEDFIVPIIIGEDTVAVDFANKLQAAGFDLRAIRPPTVPEGTSRLRISVHANHSKDLLRELAACIQSIFEQSKQFAP